MTKAARSTFNVFRGQGDEAGTVRLTSLWGNHRVNVLKDLKLEEIFPKEVIEAAVEKGLTDFDDRVDKTYDFTQSIRNNAAI